MEQTGAFRMPWWKGNLCVHQYGLHFPILLNWLNLEVMDSWSNDIQRLHTWILARLLLTARMLYICLQLRGFWLSHSGGGNTCRCSFQWLASVAFGVCSMCWTSSSKKSLFRLQWLINGLTADSNALVIDNCQHIKPEVLTYFLHWTPWTWTYSRHNPLIWWSFMFLYNENI